MQSLIRIFVLILSSLILWISGCASSTIHFPENKLLFNSTSKKQEESKSNLLPQGTKMDELDLSHCSVSAAEEKVKEWAEDKLAETRVLLYNETETPVPLKEIGIDLDYRKTMEEIGRNPGKKSPSILKFDASKVNPSLQEKLEKFNRPAKNASYKVENDKFILIPAEDGRTVDFNRLTGNVVKLSLSEVPERLVIPMDMVPATVTTEDVKTLSFDTIIGECTTKFAVQEKNRSANMTAAAKALDRKIIRPGEIFSFNDTVGPREPETGYKNAYIVVNGKYVQGTGGGVCQVSSTLYNAVLLGNLKVIERKPHAVAVNYVAPGQDATVYYPDIDFKFENNTLSLLYLRSEVQNGALTIQIWGKKTGSSVRLERQVEKVTGYKTVRRWDRNLASGRYVLEQKGAQGLVVSSWRVVKDSTGNETKLFLSRDSYAPSNRILRVGTRLS